MEIFAPCRSKLESNAYQYHEPHQGPQWLFFPSNNPILNLEFLFYVVHQTRCWQHIFFGFPYPGSPRYVLEYMAPRCFYAVIYNAAVTSTSSIWNTPLCPSFSTLLKSCISFASNLLGTFSTRQISLKKLARRCFVAKPPLYCIQWRADHLYNFFIRRDICLSATRFIISDRISSSDSTTAKSVHPYF